MSNGVAITIPKTICNHSREEHRSKDMRKRVPQRDELNIHREALRLIGKQVLK